MAKGTLNKATIIGRLGSNPELKQTQSGASVVSLSLATNNVYTDKTTGNKTETTDWISCVFWGKTAEILSKHTSKGSLIYVEGRIQSRKWTDDKGIDRYVTEVNVSNMEMLGSSNSNRPPLPEAPVNSPDFPDLGPDEIPFG